MQRTYSKPNKELWSLTDRPLIVGLLRFFWIYKRMESVLLTHDGFGMTRITSPMILWPDTLFSWSTETLSSAKMFRLPITRTVDSIPQFLSRTRTPAQFGGIIPNGTRLGCDSGTGSSMRKREQDSSWCFVPMNHFCTTTSDRRPKTSPGRCSVQLNSRCTGSCGLPYLF